MSVDEPEFVGKRIVEFLHDRPGAMNTSVIEQSEVAISSLPSPFRSPKGEARYLVAYDASMRLWPVPYESIDVTGRYGRTHVVVSRPLDAPALVLLHGDYLSLAMWSPNVPDLSRNHRVYAVDVMGQAGRSVPDRHMKNRDQEVINGVPETWSLGYVTDVILTRDPWMHRVDLARATDQDPVHTADHDGVIVADVVAEWARRHGQPYRDSNSPVLPAGAGAAARAEKRP
ncbi:MAG TPA: hypothetical protein VI094_18290 [Propionibacteriaceae bacterium]